jgi:hypothetical protein
LLDSSSGWACTANNRSSLTCPLVSSLVAPKELKELEATL